MDDRRYHGLDALRATMMLLGIVIHAGMLYISEPPPAMPIPTMRTANQMKTMTRVLRVLGRNCSIGVGRVRTGVREGVG